MSVRFGCPGLWGRWGTCLVAVLASAVVSWAVVAAPQQGQREAERKLAHVHGELKSVSTEKKQIEGQRSVAAGDLHEADRRVDMGSRALENTESSLRTAQQRLDVLLKHRADLQAGLADKRVQLAGLLTSAYETGDDAPLKLLLEQQRVTDAGRLLVYHRYLQQAKARQVRGIMSDLAELDGVETEIRSRQAGLADMRARQQVQVRDLVNARKVRAQAVSELEQRYKDKVEREKALSQDAKALEVLLANLRATAAKAEAERKALAARQAAEAKRDAARTANAGKPARKKPAAPMAVATAPAMKVGGGAWPLSGNLLARYGGRMPDGHISSGVLIAAPAGSVVTAVEDGTVVFSDWMTGYGMILIVDHGNGYMSLYAHNESLLRGVGSHVRRGEAVAKVGNSGGMGTPALYFELRRSGQPVDPASWLQRR